MNRRLRFGPPKQTLAERSGRLMWPIGAPSGLKMRTPSSSAVPMPQPHHRLPSTSTRKPSGVFRLGADDQAPGIGELGPVDNVEGVDRAGSRLALDHIELRLVGREGEPVRPLHHTVGGDRRLAGLAIDAVYPLRQ